MMQCGCPDASANRPPPSELRPPFLSAQFFNMSKEYNDLREPIDPDEALRRAVAATKPEAAAAQVSQDTTARWLLLALLGR